MTRGSKTEQPGIIYALTNEAMPGLVKIGKTNRNNPEHRMSNLYSTGVPFPFECVCAVEVDDPDKAEAALHKAFEPHRINPKREFFRIDVNLIVYFLQSMGKKDVTPEVSRQKDVLSQVERPKLYKLSERLPNLDFYEMGIPKESTLQSKHNKEDIAIVSGNKKVIFRDEEMSLSKATHISRGKSGSASGGPCQHWYYKERLLSDVYAETYL